MNQHVKKKLNLSVVSAQYNVTVLNRGLYEIFSTDKYLGCIRAGFMRGILKINTTSSGMTVGYCISYCKGRVSTAELPFLRHYVATQRKNSCARVAINLHILVIY